MNKLTEQISKHAIEYGSLPFWSWNYKLEPMELRRQIRNMHDLEMRGFFMHARGGLQTEYMSDEWFECVNACVDEAKKLGMEAWAYDENGWPSGFAGGKVLEDPDNHAVFVDAELSEEFPREPEGALAVYAIDEGGTPHRVERAEDGCKSYLTVRMGSDCSYVDTLRKDVVDKFIEYTHEVYKRRMGEDLGGVMPGFFTDEPQYYRAKTPYSKRMEEWFLEEYGYSVLDALPSLFIDYDGAELHRYDYHRLTNKKFTEAYSKTVYDWAEANGVLITGHYIEEGSLDGQMMCCGDIMPQYLYQHIPGIDYLGRQVRNYVMGKQLGSVCAQTGKKKALSEMFGCCGWDVSLKELKHIAEIQYSGGVNLMCQHLYPYSVRGPRKNDYPAFYSPHTPWQGDMREFNKYFNNLGYMLGMGEELAETLVIHPMRSAWLTYQRTPIQKVRSTVNGEFTDLVSVLSGSGATFHLGSEAIMDTMASLTDGGVRVGLCEYKQIIVPACDTLNSGTVKLIKEFMSAGGKVYTCNGHLPTRIDGKKADLSFLSDCEDILSPEVLEKFLSAQPLRMDASASRLFTLESVRLEVRKTEYGRLVYVANLTDNEFECLGISLDGCRGLGRLDIATLEITPVNGRITERGADIYIRLNGSESLVLCEYDAPGFLPYERPAAPRVISLDKPFTAERPRENLMTLDRARISLDGGEFSELRPMERIRDVLLSSRYKGRITLRFPFCVKDIPETLSVVTEPFGSEFLKINGNRVALSEESFIDRDFRRTDIAKYCTVGENTVDIDIEYYQRDYVYYVLFGGVSETLRNCLIFDTEIENIYLVGDFALDMRRENFAEAENNAFVYDPENGMALIKPREFPDAKNIVTDGYPFYCGMLTMRTKYTYKKGGATVLYLSGRFADAHVSVNGAPAEKMLFSSYLDLEKYLSEGENEIAVTVYNGYRNLFGPHHRDPAEPLSVSPRVFSFEKLWVNGECKDYHKRYAFVRFGVDQ